MKCKNATTIPDKLSTSAMFIKFGLIVFSVMISENDPYTK